MGCGYGYVTKAIDWQSCGWGFGWGCGFGVAVDEAACRAVPPPPLSKLRKSPKLIRSLCLL